MMDPNDNKNLPSAGNGARTPYTGQPDDLHNLIDVPHQDDEDPLASLRDDPNYAALIRDLESIAEAARSLFQPSEETPSDNVWDKIRSQLPTKPDA